jgi:hypothetical protein
VTAVSRSPGRRPRECRTAPAPPHTSLRHDDKHLAKALVEAKAMMSFGMRMLGNSITPQMWRLV